ncbi:MAG: hypothetical protein A3K19_27615 [Lentisphaerae bacterium RIFOXYB12_FULL_65_16]|nr:MAG: hypothetical protein A3K18_24985 [Lentisphaerae bacterium RIFOXYA12_64_32]OGV86072.1 MAG: hypothetical protein A3K19_27615 [Lentisphaerae bacterium RIFOXYB12_FULL_65_16]
MRWNGILVLPVFVMATAVVHSQPVLKNGDFEAVRTIDGPPSVDQGFGVWTLGPDKLAPADWSLNPAFPGELAIVSEGAHSGKNFLRLRATTAERDAHVYQPGPAIKPGNCYVVSAWVRGGKANLIAYEYYDKAPMKVPTILAAAPSPDQWRQVSTYYVAPEEGLTSVSLAIGVAKGETVDVDDVRIEPGPALPATLGPVTLENDLLRIRLSGRGMVEEFSSRQNGANLVTQGSPVPMFQAVRAGATIAVWDIERKGDILEVRFCDPTVTVSLKIETHPHYIALAVQQVSVPDLEWLQLANLRLQITENVGTLINAAWDKQFGACVLACNDRTHSYGADGARAALCAKAYKEFGFEGAKIAIIGTPTDTPDPTSKLLDIIEEVELDQGLPHPTINGVWIKRAPERFTSFLMAFGGNARTIDQVIELAKGGFGAVELVSWWESTPTYNVNPSMFPGGLPGLTMCADKIHAAGMQVGLHVMQGMVGWGGIGMRDPHVVPKADPRLLRDRFATLAAAIDAKATEIKVKDGTAGWPDKGDLFIDGEVVRYAERTETGFAKCARGFHGTTVAAHPEGTQVSHIVNCFDMWGSVIYAPDIKTDLVEEIADNIARVFNETGADMTYFDSGEELACQQPAWHNQGYFALNVMKRVKKPFVLEGNAIYSHLAWHVISRGGPYYDPVDFGHRDFSLRCKSQHPAYWAKNLLTGDVGWFHARPHSPAYDAVTPDEVMLLSLKALGHKAPLSFQVHDGTFYANKRLPEMLEIIRIGDALKRAQYFSEDVCVELVKPLAEHVLEQAPNGEWGVRPHQFGPARLLTAQSTGGNEWRYNNPHDAQAPWVRLRARTRLAKYADKENIVLADFDQGIPFAPKATASPELVQSVEPSAEKTPDGSSAFCYRAKNNGKARSGWCQLAMEFPALLNLSNNRRMGIWVRSEGKGGILNVQFAQGFGFQDHYIPLDFTGWAYRELDPPEDSRFWSYRWPYDFIPLMSWHFSPGSVKGVNLYYNDLPPETEVTCLIGRIEALREQPLPLESPTLDVAGQKLVFPVTLKPDEYVEMDWTGACRHFEPNGGLLAEVKPQGQLRLAQGENVVRLSCAAADAAAPRAEVTLAVKGAPLPNAAKHTGEPIKAGLATTDTRLRLLPNDKGGFRLLQGLYELADQAPPQSIPAFDGKINTWTVTNQMQTPARAAIVITRNSTALDADYDDPNGLLIESFDDPGLYAMSETNQFEKFVLGGGRQLSKTGPVREGVSQSFAVAAEDVRVGEHCGVYTATNDGAPDGWCGIGRRFAKPLDLSAYQAVAFWVCGDGKGELLRFQCYDVAGAYADYAVPIDFTGWRLLVFKTADAAKFDWKQTEYVLFYFNNLPAKTTCALKFDDLKALPKLRPPPRLCRPVLTVADKKLTTDAELDSNEALTLDATGRCLVWRAGQAEPREVKAAGDPIVLAPGPNRFELTCDTAAGAPRDVTVRVVRLGTPAP